MFQHLTDALVGVHQVGRRNALAVGRIGDDDGGILRLLEVLEVLLLDGDVVR